jgi:hypothetical protein
LADCGQRSLCRALGGQKAHPHEAHADQHGGQVVRHQLDVHPEEIVAELAAAVQYGLQVTVVRCGNILCNALRGGTVVRDGLLPFLHDLPLRWVERHARPFLRLKGRGLVLGAAVTGSFTAVNDG